MFVQSRSGCHTSSPTPSRERTPTETSPVGSQPAAEAYLYQSGEPDMELGFPTHCIRIDTITGESRDLPITIGGPGKQWTVRRSFLVVAPTSPTSPYRYGVSPAATALSLLPTVRGRACWGSADPQSDTVVLVSSQTGTLVSRLDLAGFLWVSRPQLTWFLSLEQRLIPLG